MGAMFTLGLYLILLLCILYTSSVAKDRFGRHLTLGIAGMVFWHIVMNVGMVLNLLPVTGVTLPILSYGGTSAVTIFAALGLVIACHGQRQIFV
jgi:rod shape determining protein RodA